MKIYIDADHNGFAYKKSLVIFLENKGHDVVDLGGAEIDPKDDFTMAASRVSTAVLGANGRAKGILLCGSGQGVCMAANRHKGIRAALCWDNREAKAARNDSDSNVLCLPSAMISIEKAKAITHTWLTTPFAGAVRFKRRIAQLDELG